MNRFRAFTVVFALGCCVAQSQGQENYDCKGRKIYMHDLPKEFNAEILRKCEFGLASWLDVCPHTQNGGFGPPYDAAINGDLGPGWFHTDSYMLELIFHTRMKTHPCLTRNPSAATAFFIPYYAGLDALRYLYRNNENGGVETSDGDRDNLEERRHGWRLMSWLAGRPEWRRRGGRDHFVVMGRTAWDFDVFPGGSWGTRMVGLPGVANMTALFLERRPWLLNERAVPYPTSFHPTEPRLREWTDGIRESNGPRMALFAFVGSVRPYAPEGEAGFRELLMRACAASVRCELMDCAAARCGSDARPVVAAFRRAVFCLQPCGDTATRRSTFDAIVAGCVPVFFNRDSAYTQYTWHLPSGAEEGTYSVYISQESVASDASLIERTLARIEPRRVREMQENVLRLIPRVVYMSHNGSSMSRVRDAFDITVDRVVDNIAALKEREEAEEIKS